MSPYGEAPALPDAARRSLARCERAFRGEPEAALAGICEVLVRELSVDRAAVWVPGEAGDELVCTARHEGSGLRGSGPSSAGSAEGGSLPPVEAGQSPEAASLPGVPMSRFSRYFRTLRSGGVVALPRVAEDEELVRLTRLRAGSRPAAAILDHPVLLQDDLAAVLSLERLEPVEDWSDGALETARTAARRVAGVLSVARNPDQELRATREHYRLLVESAPVAIIVHRDGEIVYANPMTARLLGARDSEDILGRQVLDFVHPEDRGLAAERIQQIREEGLITSPQELRAIRLDGKLIHVETRGIPVTYRGRRAVQALVRDITERKEAERALRDSERRYRSLFQGVKDAVYLSDPDGHILDVNPAAEELFGYDREELLELDASRLYVDPDERKRWQETLESEGAVKDFELRLRKADGREMICVETATLRTDSEGNVVSYQGIIRDVTEQRQIEERLEHQALHDALTELPNRALFWDRLEHCLARADRRGHTVGVLFADLDQFKMVNDSLGHAAGDRILAEVGHRLRSCFREEDTVARIGGDEFTVLLESVASRGDAVEGAERLLWVLQEPFTAEDREFTLTASIGIALYSPADSLEEEAPSARADLLLRRADAAMYRAKEAGGNQFLVSESPEDETGTRGGKRD